LQQNVGDRNVMSVSFLRLRTGPILFFYLVKHAVCNCQVWMRRSDDEGHTWSEPSPVSSKPGYHVMNNARVIQLSGGRVLAPVALSSDINTGPPSRVFCYLSDDEGNTWREGDSDAGFVGSPAQEPGLAELGDGSVLMIIRTRLGHVYGSRSRDGGETWDAPVATPLVSPAAPATIARIPGTDELVIVWNDNPAGADARWQDRTPLAAAISQDDGVTWKRSREIESDRTRCYAYASITSVEKDALLTYYQWDRVVGNRPFERTSLKFTRVPVDWLRPDA
jgi:sialidase-1